MSPWCRSGTVIIAVTIFWKLTGFNGVRRLRHQSRNSDLEENNESKPENHGEASGYRIRGRLKMSVVENWDSQLLMLQETWNYDVLTLLVAREDIYWLEWHKFTWKLNIKRIEIDCLWLGGRKKYSKKTKKQKRVSLFTDIEVESQQKASQREADAKYILQENKIHDLGRSYVRVTTCCCMLVARTPTLWHILYFCTKRFHFWGAHIFES